MYEMTALEDWMRVWERSVQHPVFVFKHSTSCMISARANRQVKKYRLKEGSVDVYRVKVIEERHLSNQIAADTNIPHKSPQILLIHKKKILWHTSHWKITEHQLQKVMRGKAL